MKASIYILGLLILFACQTNDKSIVFSEDYMKGIDQHKEKIFESRKKNYLSLVGLYKLEPGMQSFGSIETNTLHLDVEDAPGKIGVFDVGEDSIYYLSITPGEKNLDPTGIG